MEVGKLTVQVRSGKGKGPSRRLRANGTVPGVCYGESLDKPLLISVNPKQLKQSLDPNKRRNTVISVTVEDNGSTRQLTAMLKDFQIDPLHQQVIHVDLLAIDVNKEVEVDVPVHLIGKAVGTVDGGQIHVVRHDVLVTCKPVDIPVEFQLDITPLKIGDALHISDLKLPAGVKFAMPANTTLVTCVAPKAEKVEAAAEGEAAAAAEGAAPAEGAKPAEGAAAAPAAAGDKAGAKPAADKGGDKKAEAKGGGEKGKK